NRDINSLPTRRSSDLETEKNRQDKPIRTDQCFMLFILSLDNSPGSPLLTFRPHSNCSRTFRFLITKRTRLYWIHSFCRFASAERSEEHTSELQSRENI